jgi:hypothetical protein
MVEDEEEGGRKGEGKGWKSEVGEVVEGRGRVRLSSGRNSRGVKEGREDVCLCVRRGMRQKAGEGGEGVTVGGGRGRD